MSPQNQTHANSHDIFINIINDLLMIGIKNGFSAVKLIVTAGKSQCTIKVKVTA
jgi:hypothetical protein